MSWCSPRYLVTRVQSWEIDEESAEAAVTQVQATSVTEGPDSEVWSIEPID